jgi:hypothetical protein
MDKRRIAFEMRRGPRPKTLHCVGCRKKFDVQARGRLPLFCSQSCRQRAYEKRRWSRPSVVEALAQDLATSEGRAIMRNEVLAILRQYRLITYPTPPPTPARKRPELRLIE